MLGLTWLRGLAARRRGRLAAAAAGVAIAVAVLASIGSFLSASKATMTRRSVADVAVDWQVEAQSGFDPATVLDRVKQAAGVRRPSRSGSPRPPGSRPPPEARPRRPGPASWSACPTATAPRSPPCSATWPAPRRACCSRSRPRPTSTPRRATRSRSAGPAWRPCALRVDGVVDLPQADSFFQKVGAPIGAQPQAPPDNVLVMPAAQWQPVVRPARPPNARTWCALRCMCASAMIWRRTPRPPMPRSRDGRATSRCGWPAPGWWATTWPPPSAPPAPTRSTPRCSSCSSGSPARCWPGCSPRRSRASAPSDAPQGAGAAAGPRRDHESAGPARRARGRGRRPRRCRGRARLGAGGRPARLRHRRVRCHHRCGHRLGERGGPRRASRSRRRQWRRPPGATRVMSPSSRAAAASGASPVPRVGLASASTCGCCWRAAWCSGSPAGAATSWSSRPKGVPTISVSYWAFAGPALLWSGAALLAWRLADLVLGRGRA